MLGGLLWLAKGLGATFASSPSLEPAYSVGFLGGLLLFFAAFALAAASLPHARSWLGTLLLAFVATFLLIGIGGPLRSAGLSWYGVELPIVLAGLLWAVLGLARWARPQVARSA